MENAETVLDPVSGLWYWVILDQARGGVRIFKLIPHDTQLLFIQEGRVKELGEFSKNGSSQS